MTTKAFITRTDTTSRNYLLTLKTGCTTYTDADHGGTTELQVPFTADTDDDRIHLFGSMPVPLFDEADRVLAAHGWHRPDRLHWAVGGRTISAIVDSTPAATTEPAQAGPDDLLTVRGVTQHLAEHHDRHIAPGTWRSYVARNQAPKPVRKVGRESLWNPADIDTWATRHSPEAERIHDMRINVAMALNDPHADTQYDLDAIIRDLTEAGYGTSKQFTAIGGRKFRTIVNKHRLA
jgi:hypothetical protein